MSRNSKMFYGPVIAISDTQFYKLVASGLAEDLGYDEETYTLSLTVPLGAAEEFDKYDGADVVMKGNIKQIVRQHKRDSNPDEIEEKDLCIYHIPVDKNLGEVIEEMLKYSNYCQASLTSEIMKMYSSK